MRERGEAVSQVSRIPAEIEGQADGTPNDVEITSSHLTWRTNNLITCPRSHS